MRLLFLLLWASWASAQCPPSGYPLMGNACPLAPVLCQSIDGYCGTLSPTNVAKPFPGCTGFILNNDAWLSFYAASSTISLKITPSNCNSIPNSGMQGGIYRGCAGAPLALQCLCTDAPFVLTASNFEIGEIYTLVLDGCLGDTCHFEIQVVEGSTGKAVDSYSICKNDCLSLCDSSFCGEGLHAAFCPDSTGNTVPYLFCITEVGSDATISGGGSLTCILPSVKLSAQNAVGQIAWSNTAGAVLGNSTDLWVDVPGIYTLNVTQGACESERQILVKDSRQLPQVTAIGGEMDAQHPTIELKGNSINAGAVYQWTGPNGFITNIKNPVVSVPGIYTLTVTIPSTGCAKSADATVTQN